jgi:O-succinylhomoserine sulfhydrylase
MSQDDRRGGTQTRAVRAGTMRSQFNEHSEALFLTSSFVFDSAEQAARRFAGQEEGYVYSRFSNPTVRMFEQRLAALEGGQDCLATASGMSAILILCLAHLKAGDHVLCSANVFGATVQLFSNQLARFGIETTFVSGTDPSGWRAAARPRTRLMFCETPSNPMMEVVDLDAFAAAGRELGALTVVDNCFCTPALQRPLEFGVDLVMHTGTKYLDGQGRVLGGALVGRTDFVREVLVPTLRTTGPSLSPFNAGLESHPQHALARRQQSGFGAVVGFELKAAQAEARQRAWRLIDAVRLLSITANLGDTRSTITHPATTTHGRLTAEMRQRAGIDESLVRIAVGLEDVEDLQQDLQRGLEA